MEVTVSQHAITLNKAYTQYKRIKLGNKQNENEGVGVHAEYIMRKAGLDEAQAVIKIARRNTNNLRYADDTTRMAESE